ncbi:hypothetical protein AURDEDRAFT_164464 [Auricularia subglabra TFB-10046 SS5]|nr:hypothetical protein AURDEDRAFT_164464 [Auricularia subglabra TFB-10046 SS5]
MSPNVPVKLPKRKRFTARMTTGGRPPRPQSTVAIINRRRAERARRLGRTNVRTRSETRQLEADRAQLDDEGYVYDEETDSFVRPPSQSLEDEILRSQTAEATRTA